jgi:hypothetical protein
LRLPTAPPPDMLRHMPVHLRRLAGLSGLGAAAVTLVVSLGPPASPGRTITSERPPLISPSTCPREALALPADAVAAAAAVALRAEHPADRPRILTAGLADHGGPRGAMVRGNCGRRLWHRTVAVAIDLRRFHPSASLSERVSFVARTADGYTVYALGH